MKALGDQWIETIDGHEHIVKAVEGDECHGCMFGSRFVELVTAYDGDSEWHEYDHVCKLEKCPFDTEELVVKDLGILHDGLLSEERTGKYPTYVVEKRFGEHMNEEKHWHKFYVFSNGTNVEAGGWTFQEAIDAWNRRA